MRVPGGAVAVAMLALWAGVASAHPTNNGTVVANITPETRRVDFMISVSARDLGDFLKLDRDGNNVVDRAEFETGSQVVATYLASKTAVRNDGVLCPAIEQRFVTNPAQPKLIHFVRQFECRAALGEIELENRVLFEDVGGYRHFARIQLGETVHTATFARGFPTFLVTVPSLVGETPPTDRLGDEELGEVFVRYTWEGVLHILGGIDHVLFVICLLVIARDLRKLLGVITAFTVGHSVTLVLSALDIVAIPASVIEPIIALSIMFVAAENMFRARQEEDPKYRFLITALFGLVHGFGFSYVLRDEVGLPTQTLLPALLSFNIGVELGQIAIVLAAYPLLRWLMKSARYRYVVWALSGPVFVVAAYWFVERAAGMG